jgi:FAD-dependent monooxygenase
MIDQDEKDTFTAHYPLRDVMQKALDPREVVYKMLGGCLGKWEIKIDEVLVHSEWQPSFSVARTYSSDKGRVLLAGDAGTYDSSSALLDFAFTMCI